MKAPQTPPAVERIWEELDTEQIENIVRAVPGPLADGKYLHWDKLRYHRPPSGISHEHWWWMLKFRRNSLYKSVPLQDKENRNFRYLLVDPLPERLHKIDQGAGGMIKMPEQITNPETRDQYYVNSLIQEAITSSQLEGAATTRRVAKEMIKSGRRPRDRSEQMILNNFITMQRISKLKDKPLTAEMVMNIHRTVTENTLDDPSAAGRLRRENEWVVVGDIYNEVFHDPPKADELEKRMDAMCDFANETNSTGFIHPVLRSIILHFWLAYDHPFIDGNGRTARALFYWSMLRHGFWLFEFISISQIILNAPVKYGRAFLYTETDENDLTYFIIYHLDIIMRAIEELHSYIQRRTAQLQALENQLRSVATLNHRQRALISHALRHPQYRYTIRSHQTSHNVVYQTARSDLLELADLGLLKMSRVRKVLYFEPVAGLEPKLKVVGG